MSIIVQKFGGTSVADSSKILAAARRAIRAQMDGHQVVVVVSAMGKNTDALVALAREISEEPPAREMDMLLSTGEQVSVALMAMAISALGHEAVSLTGAQIGIMTDSTHTKARIQSISSDRMREALDAGKIVIAAGFQGVDQSGNITTLGRGGSDTTAVALAAVLQAKACEIYTDVDGVYTTDPRLVPEARRVERISYDEMLELSSAGAGVMHNRAIEFAKRFHVPVHVRSSFSDTPGTMIAAEVESPHPAVCGCAKVKEEARMTVLGVPDRPGAALAVFSKIAAKNVAMDMIVQNVAANGCADISFTVFRGDLPATLRAVEEAVAELGAEGVNYDEDVSKVSVVGLGMAEQAGVARRMFRALADRGVNIQMISTSEIKISALVAREGAVEALRTAHETFELHREPIFAADLPKVGAAADGGRNAVEVAARMEGMEEMVIDDIALDAEQARVTVLGLPDVPGLAAQVFERVAEGGINVDMIVQSIEREGRASISFTIPRSDLKEALRVTTELSKELGCPPPTSAPEVAKLSVFGIGMRSHTRVAHRAFQCLARAGINVEMISTSEVRLNVVVDAARGEKALAALEEEFADVRL